MATTAFDLAQAHAHLAPHCFNATWTLLDLPERTPEQDELMLLCAMASYYHWTQRPDCTTRNRGIATWQIARVYAVLGQADNARRFATRCLELSQGDTPFFLAYAHEAMARAAHLAADHATRDHHLAQARQLLPAIAEADDRAMLAKDLDTIG